MRMYNVYLKKYGAVYIPAEDAEKVYSRELDKWYLRFYRDKEMIAEFDLDEVAGWEENLPELGGNRNVAC